MTGGIVEGALAAGFKVLAEKMTGAVLAGAGRSVSALLDKFSTDLEPHLEANFERCSQIKTLLNKSEPVNLLSLYVKTKFTTGRKKAVEDYDVIDSVQNRDRRCNIIVSGTGGGGKTVFMKYLWISLFVNPNGRIPVFIELRRINDFSSDDLMSYVFRSIVDIKSKISINQFNEAVSRGVFVFIFDGFDEINKERKNSIENQIIKLTYENPKLALIISGRPDERFSAWQHFTNFTVKPFDKKQVIELIKKLDYDKKVKLKFISQIDSSLYKRHPTFLSNPLLATMMLLTFDQFAEIPQKTFIFYEQAFDTLFLKHDATKEGFQRKKYTSLTVDVFKKYFSYFCLFSYYEEKFEFSETEVLEFIEKAFKMDVAGVDKEDFLRDLIESVCIMQRDGFTIEFTHRSFQEYFSAYCLDRHIDSGIGEILAHLTRRPQDNVISMLFEMRREKFEKEFVIPNAERILEMCRRSGADKDLLKNAELFGWVVAIAVTDKVYGFAYGLGDLDHMIVTTLERLYPDCVYHDDDSISDSERKGAASIVKKYNMELGETDISLLQLARQGGHVKIDKKTKEKTYVIDVKDLEGTWTCKKFLGMTRTLEKIVHECTERHRKISRNLNQILGLSKARA